MKKMIFTVSVYHKIKELSISSFYNYLIVFLLCQYKNLKKVLLGEEREKAEDLLCKVALEGIYRYQRKEDNNHGI